MSNPNDEVSGTPEEVTRVIVREYPETIYFYPTAIVGLIIYVLQGFEFIADEQGKAVLGLIFLCFFTWNFFIVAFEFSLSRTLMLVGLLIIIILLYIVLKSQGITFPQFQLTLPDFSASAEMYLAISLIIIIHLIIAFIASRFDYWLFTPTEIYHYRGFFGDSRRFGAQGAKVFKTTPDLFENLLFLSGDIYVLPEREEQFFRIKNVFKVAEKERKIRQVLSYVPDTQLQH